MPKVHHLYVVQRHVHPSFKAFHGKRLVHSRIQSRSKEAKTVFYGTGTDILRGGSHVPYEIYPGWLECDALKALRIITRTIDEDSGASKRDRDCRVREITRCKGGKSYSGRDNCSWIILFWIIPPISVGDRW